ncbi:DoxX family protein [Chitinimonas naiadis]
MTTQIHATTHNHFDQMAIGQLLLRSALGLMWFTHGFVLKFLTFGVSGLADWMSGIGYPAWAAAPLILAEVIGGIAILLGIYGRWVSLALLPILVGALQIHSGNGWVFSNTGGGWEYPLFLIAASLIHTLLGDGPLALRRR